jgi:hypothetical protein
MSSIIFARFFLYFRLFLLWRVVCVVSWRGGEEMKRKKKQTPDEQEKKMTKRVVFRVV